ncbi:MAG: DUF1311 domain-containing protein [Hydrogenophaga sp.]|uniref:lysozyme inhibitor LprI family protein n=1 Tax=Hydrogenophaga sp. TaxID=1904254 RepID=UPI0016AA216A|nr:lysozyme inhibitor LprI family protein [Hydrogenophaga sp.]NIM41197.1 DUF1311 domain-containing protein [Hydrogenophaga sp.]NIN26513.1 DUF1311 domain-containing protein [Hydrogenophaga sp.]NIN31388.1 DUF1311 domain-containing protein [Hydrogenophaga sp.]NIN55443.1 DUF1311 domain-containing protein [Hydrogenophaga sp.]NIO51778.1 DUF1311 domain-containing protein [Hydrogenophaga sp.]
MRRLAPLLCLCLAALASGAAAQTADELPKDCAKAETQRQLTACAYRDFEHAQAAYTAVFRELFNGLDTARRTLLRTAQKDWLAYRTSTCEFESSAVRGGSAEPMTRLQCQTRVTRERTNELRRQLNCPEGDLTCLRPVRP